MRTRNVPVNEWYTDVSLLLGFIVHMAARYTCAHRDQTRQPCSGPLHRCTVCHAPTCRACYATHTLLLCCIAGCNRPTGCARVTFRGCAAVGCHRGLCDMHGMAVCIIHLPGRELCGTHWMREGACVLCTPKDGERTVQQLLDDLGVPDGTLDIPE